jgi:hypothetical protein
MVDGFRRACAIHMPATTPPPCSWKDAAGACLEAGGCLLDFLQRQLARDGCEARGLHTGRGSASCWLPATTGPHPCGHNGACGQGWCNGPARAASPCGSGSHGAAAAEPPQGEDEEHARLLSEARRAREALERADAAHATALGELEVGCGASLPGRDLESMTGI